MLLDIKNIDVLYDDFQVIWDVSINVDKAEMVALLGPNGSGKSTILNTISNLVEHKNGTGPCHCRVCWHRRAGGWCKHRRGFGKQIFGPYPWDRCHGSHGEAIASGIYYELKLSNKILNLENSILDQYEDLINKLNLVTKYKFKNKKDELITALQNDKKASKSGIDIVLLSKLSDPVIKEISFEKIFEVVDFE